MSTETDLVRTGDPAESLRLINAWEASIKPGLFSRLLLRVGRTALFAAIYRRIGPRLDVWLNRRFGGRVAARLYGVPELILITTGAKTGLSRPSPLLYVRDGDCFFVVGTNFGQAHHPAWTGNLLKQPEAAVEIGAARLAVEAVLLGEDEFAAMWPRFVAIYPGYTGYLARSGRTPRMFRLRPRAAS